MKKLFSCIVFCLIVFCLLPIFNPLLIPKSENRYYILEEYLKDTPEHNLHDVQVYGSCHAYTSFNPLHLEKKSGISAFVYANASEIIPTTYARMVSQFKKHTPKVAVVEIWGINPYETYIGQSRVFGDYLSSNLESVDFSLAKQEVINDFRHMEYKDINFLTMNFPIFTYHDRLLDGSLKDVDFYYSFEATKPYSSAYMFNEMTSRLQNNGYKKNDSKPIEDYPDKQHYIKEDEFLEIEPDIVKYIKKIIDLCEKNNVELIFYRSPYTSTENELRKINHLQQICDENGVLFFDLEKEIQYDYSVDFLDYQHLSVNGANKSTEFLMPYIIESVEERS